MRTQILCRIFKPENHNFDLVVLLLFFLDEPNVTLSGQCHGEVMINGREVCSSTWRDEDSQLVCQQECGNAIPGVPSLKPRPPLSNMDYYHVSCESYHYKLGNCKRFMGKCDKKVVYVSCTGKYVSIYRYVYVLFVPSK